MTRQRRNDLVRGALIPAWVILAVCVAAFVAGCVGPGQWTPPLTPVERSAWWYAEVQKLGEGVGAQMKSYADAGLLTPEDAAEAKRLYEAWADAMDRWHEMNLAVDHGEPGAILNQMVVDAATNALTQLQRTILDRAQARRPDERREQ